VIITVQVWISAFSSSHLRRWSMSTHAGTEYQTDCCILQT